MRIKSLTSCLLSAVTFLAWSVQGQTYDTNNVVVSTFAGIGFAANIDGQGQFSAFSSPSQVASDTAGNLYVWDGGNYRIRKITPDGTVSTFAGGGTAFEGYRTNVSLAWGGQVGALTIDTADQLWLAMGAYNGGYSGGTMFLIAIGTNGNVSVENGNLTNLTASSGVCFDSANNLYYSGGNRIYRYNPSSKTVQPFAGNGVAAYLDGQGAVFTAFSSPGALACDQADNIYVWDSGNGRIRMVDNNQNVTTLAGREGSYYYSQADGVGTNAAFSYITSLFPDRAGNLYFVGPHYVRKMDAQRKVTTLAGNFSYFSSSSTSFADGAGNLARFNFNTTSGGCFARGMVFVGDYYNHRIRCISFNAQGQPLDPANLELKAYPGIKITGNVGRTYQIQSSPDMNVWNTVAKVLLPSSPYVWVDQAPISGNKFYRAVLLP